MQRQQLQALPREELIREAERAGVPRPRVLTQAELVDEILKRTAGGDTKRARGLLGRARDLIATVVEKGLHLPDAAAAIRGPGPRGWPPPPPPLPTVTLAEIYAAQGHLDRAVAVLDEVLAREPDHQEARELRERFQAQLARGPKGASEPPIGAAKTEPAPVAAGDEELEKKDEEQPAPAPTSAAVARASSLPETTQRSREQPPVLDLTDAGPTEPVVVVGDPEETLSAPSIDIAPLLSVATKEEAASTEPVPGQPIEPAAVTAPAREDRPAAAGIEAPAAREEPQKVATEARAGEPALPLEKAAGAAIEAPAVREERQKVATEARAGEPALPLEKAAEAAAEAIEPGRAAALPESYDVDEVVALAVDPSTFYVYWEVRPTTFAHMAVQAPGGALALRVMAVTPGWDGPIVETRDVPIDALHGDHFIHHVRPRADVRVSVGWVKDGQFDPIAVGAEVSAPSAFVAAGAPAPGGAPLDLSEGPHGSRDTGLASFARPVTFGTRGRPAERIAAGWLPRELFGTTMEGATDLAGAGEGGRAGTASWIWAPAPGAEATSVPITFGPSEVAQGPVRAPGAAAAPWWGGASEGGPQWGGASEGGPRWGGASEAAPR